MTDTAILLRDDRDGIAHLTLNRPAARNSLSRALLAALRDTLAALSRTIGRKAAMRMLLTGDPIDAPTALGLGLVNEIVDPGRLAAHTRELAAGIAAKSPLTLAIGKEAFYRQAEMPLAEAYAYTAGVMAANLDAADAREGIGAFLDKRPAVWRGC